MNFVHQLQLDHMPIPELSKMLYVWQSDQVGYKDLPLALMNCHLVKRKAGENTILSGFPSLPASAST